MRYGFDYITSGSYAGDWNEVYFPVDTTVTLTTSKGDDVTTTFTEGTSIVGAYVGINISSGAVIAYRRSDTAKVSLQDPDYQAVLDYATTQGYTLPSAGQQTLQNQLVVDLKSAGVWSKLDSFSVFATDGDADFALIDWVRLTTQTAVNSPTFTTNQGYQGDGTSSYLKTGYTPSTDGVNYTLNSGGAFVKVFANSVSGFKFLYGSLSTYSIQLGEDNSAGDMRPRVNTSSTAPSVPFTSPRATFYNNSRVDANNIKFYQDTLETTITDAVNGLADGEVEILARTGGVLPSDAGISIFGVGGDFSSENTDLNNAISTYITSL